VNCISDGYVRDVDLACSVFCRGDMCRRILIVENRPLLADRVALLVERIGHQVRIACDGEAALVVAQNFNPEVILLDRTVPDIDGCPVEVALCAVSKDAHIQTFVVSVSDDVKDRHARLCET